MKRPQKMTLLELANFIDKNPVYEFDYICEFVHRAGDYDYWDKLGMDDAIEYLENLVTEVILNG